MSTRALDRRAGSSPKRDRRRSATGLSAPIPLTGEAATRDRIVETALVLFRHYGHTKTTLSDIAQACEMSRANVYRFFESKSAIAETICARMLAALADDLGAIAAGTAPASSRLVAMAERVTRFNRDGERSDERIHALLVSAVEADSIAVRRFVHDARIRFASVVGEGMAAGEFAADDPARIARYLCFALIGFWHPSVTDRCSAFADVHDVPELVDFLLSGLRSGRSAAGATWTRDLPAVSRRTCVRADVGEESMRLRADDTEGDRGRIELRPGSVIDGERE